MSSARTVFFTDSGYHAPPLTLASPALISTSRPDTMPMPVTTAAPGTSPSYSWFAASVDSSRKGVPGSSSRSMRSRTRSLFCLRRRSMSRCGRSNRALRCRSRRSSASLRLCATFAANSGERGFRRDSIRFIGSLVLDDAALVKKVEHGGDFFLQAHLVALEHELGVGRLFVRIVNAGEVLDLAGARLLVEALRVALLGDRERR